MSFVYYSIHGGLLFIKSVNGQSTIGFYLNYDNRVAHLHNGGRAHRDIGLNPMLKTDKYLGMPLNGDDGERAPMIV